MTLVEPVSINLTGDGGEPERLEALKVSDNLFATIGLMPLLGRTFGPGEGGSEPVVVSEAFWLRRFGGDSQAVGRTITLDGAAHVVVGVVPREFNYPRTEIDVLIATDFSPAILAERGSYSWNVVAKLRAGGLAGSGTSRDASDIRGARSRGAGHGARRCGSCRAAARRPRARRLSDADGIVGRGCIRPADRLRQRREPHARARGSAAEGASDPQSARRRARPRAAPVADGKLSAGRRCRARRVGDRRGVLRLPDAPATGDAA